jgi:predicted enzyme related to lactoylglutathione lyase
VGRAGPAPHRARINQQTRSGVDDIEATVKAVLDAGGTMQQEINDVGNGRRVAAVIDAEGNVLGFIQDA